MKLVRMEHSNIRNKGKKIMVSVKIVQIFYCCLLC